MMQQRSPSKYLVGKLVESGRLKPASLAIKRNFGKILEKFNREKFYKFANKIGSDSITPGGLYMPCLVDRKVFLNNGGFPEGNIRSSSLQEYIETGRSDIATLGEQLIPGDLAFIKALESNKINHHTVNSAVAYHFQEGEKSESKEYLNTKIKSGIKLSSIPSLQNDRFTHRYLMQSTLVKNVSQLDSEVSNPRVEITINHNKFSVSNPLRRIIIDIPSFNNKSLNVTNVLGDKVDSIMTHNCDFDLNSATLNDVHVYFSSVFQVPPEIDKLNVEDINRAVLQELELSFKLHIKSSFFSQLKSKIPYRLKILIRILLNRN